MIESAEGDADARGDQDLVSVDLDRQMNIPLHAFGDPGDVGDIGDVLDQNREFVSSEARYRIFRPEAGAQTGGHAHQKIVSAGMTKSVIDPLEVIEIQKHDREIKLGMSVLARHGELQPIKKQGSIGQSGQGIVQGIVLQFEVVLLFVANVAIADKISHLHAGEFDGSHQHGHIDKIARLVQAHGFERRAAVKLHGVLKHVEFVAAGFRNENVVSISTNRFVAGESEEALKLPIDM